MTRTRIKTLLAAVLTAWIAATNATAQDRADYILTPEAPATPRINGARVYGARPGADFLYRIPCTG